MKKRALLIVGLALTDRRRRRGVRPLDGHPPGRCHSVTPGRERSLDQRLHRRRRTASHRRGVGRRGVSPGFDAGSRTEFRSSRHVRAARPATAAPVRQGYRQLRRHYRTSRRTGCVARVRQQRLPVVPLHHLVGVVQEPGHRAGQGAVDRDQRSIWTRRPTVLPTGSTAVARRPRRHVGDPCRHPLRTADRPVSRRRRIGAHGQHRSIIWAAAPQAPLRPTSK